MALSRITEAVASFTDLTIGDDLTLNDDLLLASDAGKISFGADADVSLTHVHNTGLLLNSTMAIQFNDASQFINAPSATVLDINATDEIELNATLIDVNGNLDVSGTIVSGGTLTATTSIGIGSAVLTEAELELLDGITAGAGAASKALVLDASADVASGLRNLTASGTLQGTTITATTAFVPDASDGAALGTTSLEFSDLFLADGAVIALGADQDVTLTHVADTGILLNSTMAIQFNDASQFINAPSATVLDINATDEIELNATLIDVNGNLDVSGTIVGASTLSATTGTFSGILKTDDATEATSTTDGSLQTDGGLSVVKDAVFGDDIKLLSDSAVIHFGADSDITLTHAADTSLATNGVMIATTFEPTGDTAVGDNAAIGYTSAEGLILTGQGSTSDITLKNDADATVFTVPTGTDDILFPDNAKAMFGAGSDLQIYHDGSNSYVKENGTGTLNVQGTNLALASSAGEYYLFGSADSAVYLYHNNIVKMATSANGITIGATDDQAVVAAAEPLVVVADGASVGTNEVAHFAYPQTSGALYGMRLRQVVTSGVVNHTFATYSNGTEYASNLVLEGGQVAIGSSSPAFQLDVRGNVAANYLAYFFNDGNNANRYGVLIGAGADSGDGTLIGFADGDGTGVGGITFSGGTVTYGAFTAQHPCIIPDADNDPDSDLPAYPYGTLLETTSLSYTPKSDGTDSERGIRYNVRKTQTANSKAVLGAYGCSMNGGPENQTNEHQALVLGDGHILCNNSGGNIEMGDGICSSAAVGIGQKATASPSMIIGIAQEAVTFSSDTETKLVAVQYGLQQFIPWS